MNNGKQSEQLLKVLGGHSASLDRTSKCRGLSEQPLYSGGHKAMQHETRNWNNFDKCEPEQQYRLGTVSYKITGGLKPVLQVPNLTLSFCSGSQADFCFDIRNSDFTCSFTPTNPTDYMSINLSAGIC